MERKGLFGNIVRNIRKYGHNSILIRNFILIFIMMTLPLMIISLMIKSDMENTVQEEIGSVNDASLLMTSRTMDTVLDKLFSFSYYLTENNYFRLLFLSNPDEIAEKYGDVYEKQLRLNMLIEEYIDSVYIYLEQQDFILYCDKPLGSGISAVFLEDMKDMTWLPYYEGFPSGQNYVLCSRTKRDIYPYLLMMILPVQNHSGAVMVNVDIRKLCAYLGYGRESEQRFYMIGSEGQLYFSNDESLLGDDPQVPEYLKEVYGGMDAFHSLEIEGTNYTVSVSESDKFSCRYVLCTPTSRYEDRMKKVDDYVRNMILLSTVLGIIVAYIVTWHSFVPIQHIMDELDEADSEAAEDMEDAYLGEGSQEYMNEIHYITGMVRKSRLRSKRFYLETDSWMKKLNKAQMIALQSQINPHYLYNTLDMINWKAVELLGSRNSVSEMISSLAQFFRIGLERSSYLISVTEELEHARLYTKIIEKRHEGAVCVKWDIDETVLSYKMIRLTLQPLIENALSHGLRPKRYQGNIIIRGGCMDDFLFLTVEDDGIGMEDEECAAINYELMNNYESDSERVGIRNVNQRIKILFGDEYGISLVRNEEGGLKVRMILPKKE